MFLAHIKAGQITHLTGLGMHDMSLLFFKKKKKEKKSPLAALAEISAGKCQVQENH